MNAPHISSSCASFQHQEKQTMYAQQGSRWQSQHNTLLQQLLSWRQFRIRGWVSSVTIQKINGHAIFKLFLHLTRWKPSQGYSVNLYILIIGRFLFTQRRRINASIWHWHPRWYSIQGLDHWIHLLMYTFTRGCIQTQLLGNSLHVWLGICGNMSLLLRVLQATLLALNTTPRPLFQAFQQWSWHMWSL